MADHDPPQESFLATLKKLGQSLLVLGRAMQDTNPLREAAEGTGAGVPDEPALPLALPAPQSHFEDAQLLTQHTPGWHTAHPAHLPVPTWSPVMTAFGIVFMALGAVTVWPLSVLGAALFVLAIAKWIGELLHD